MADLCREMSINSRASGKPDANEYLETMAFPTELLVADPHTDAELQGNLLQDYGREFEQLREKKITQTVLQRWFEDSRKRTTLHREFSLPQSEKASRARGSIPGNTKIGLVLCVKVCFHQERYVIEILIKSLLRDGTASWVRIVNGINKYVTETSETIALENVEHRVSGKPVCKSKATTKACVKENG